MRFGQFLRPSWRGVWLGGLGIFIVEVYRKEISHPKNTERFGSHLAFLVYKRGLMAKLPSQGLGGYGDRGGVRDRCPWAQGHAGRWPGELLGPQPLPCAGGLGRNPSAQGRSVRWELGFGDPKKLRFH